MIYQLLTKAELKKKGIRFRKEQDNDDEEEDSDDFDDDDEDDWAHGRKGSMATDLASSKKNDIS